MLQCQARYSPQTVSKADGSPGTHGDVLKPEHSSSRSNYPPQTTTKAPSRTPSMVKISEYAAGTIPVGRVPSHTSDPSRSHPPSPANNPASSGPLPLSHTESSKPEAAKGSHSPSYQIWHPPTPITQHSTPQGGLQPLNGASEGQKPPSATRLAPSSSPAVVPNIANESPSNGQYGQFLHPSSAAMRPRTISTDSTRNKPKDVPPSTTSRSPKDSPVQSVSCHPPVGIAVLTSLYRRNPLPLRQSLPRQRQGIAEILLNNLCRFCYEFK